MSRNLQISVGAHSDRGRKAANQDFYGALIPEEPLLGLKGIAVVLADGISSSNVSHIASESAVKSFLTDYYCTSDSWSVKNSAQRVLEATNSWLHSQTRRSQYAHSDKDKGYVCTLSAIVLKSATAHIFHIGDSRIYRVAGQTLEQLTRDHRIAVSSQQSYLSRALGINPSVEIDYSAIAIEKGDIFVLATDGVYEHAGNRFTAKAIHDHAQDLDEAARIIVGEALRQGSQDNLTIQIVRVDDVPGSNDAAEMLGRPSELPPAPLLEPRMLFDGYRIVRELHGSSRSHIYLAVDTDSEALVAIKTPSIDLRDDPAYLKRFMMEEWVARRIDSPHVLKPCSQTRKRNYLYVATEFIDGQTLAQWMIDHPNPDLETMRGIVEQIAKGLRAFHRKEMLHQDLRPANIMIDKTGTAKIIDFGATKIAGVAEAAPDTDGGILGTLQYTAPEYFRGERGSPRSDLFSLGVITYQMLTGKLPYGAQIAKARTKSQLGKLKYEPARSDTREIPPWIDGALRKALHPDPYQRYESLSEFVFDLRHPNAKYLNASATPLIERNPTLFWKCATLILACTVVGLLAMWHLRP
ncbi:bifunctional protein-serine/threonine kinase/phosphatase [Bradyrhizobium sp. S69]|uniref:bifunctional protein-serine/threonine kinase/phosphatase n=1 Tax=Bradyrhizobium sp. S69 TaxID=1641856 RepID=UPI00131BB725|nr:bifunctional protein-serine/threonine kinase/phosphatase [Bradyrhizobium sp. S69]